MVSNVLIFVGIIGLFWLAVNRLDSESRRSIMKKRIAQLRNRVMTAPKAMQDVSLRRKSNDAKGLVYWLMKPLPDFKRLGDRLEWAGRNISPKTYAFHRLVTFLIAVFFVTGVLHKSLLLGVSLGIVIGVWLPFKLLQRRINKKNKAFLRLFPDAIDLIIRGLRSGLPVSESLVLVSTEVPEPLGGVFTTIGHMMKLGVTLEKALQELARKLDMTEFNFFTTSIILQRETGGNLAEILNNLSEVLRARYIMRLTIKAKSAEAQMAARIVGALPFVVIAAITFLSPNYMTPLYSDPTGRIWGGAAAGLMLLGFWIMNRMTQFEI